MIEQVSTKRLLHLRLPFGLAKLTVSTPIPSSRYASGSLQIAHDTTDHTSEAPSTPGIPHSSRAALTDSAVRRLLLHMLYRRRKARGRVRSRGVARSAMRYI